MVEFWRVLLNDLAIDSVVNNTDELQRAFKDFVEKTKQTSIIVGRRRKYKSAKNELRKAVEDFVNAIVTAQAKGLKESASTH